MSARIRATRKTLAKDAIALRELVNQIRIAKAKTKASFTDVNSIKIWNVNSNKKVIWKLF